jgi:hypothetical protein
MDIKIATAHVRDSWMGGAIQTVDFVAAPNWNGPESGVVEGERVVLFLRMKPGFGSVRGSPPGCYEIPIRMPIRDVGSVKYATIMAHSITLPGGTPTVGGPAPDHRRYVELSVLKNALLKVISEFESQPD